MDRPEDKFSKLEEALRAGEVEPETALNSINGNHNRINHVAHGGTIINGQVNNNYSVNIAVKPEQTQGSDLDTKKRELIAKVFIGGLFFIGSNIALKVFAGDPLGWVGELLSFGAVLGVIGASAIIFKK